MKYSCVILNFEDFDNTFRCIKMVKKFCDVDIICIVDNCSADGSLEKLKTFENDIIKVIPSKKNGGYGYGNNIGINYVYRHSSAEYVLVMNPDVEIEEICISKIIEAMSMNDISAATGIPISVTGKKKEIPGWNIPDVYTYLLQMNFFLYKIIGKKKKCKEQYIQKYDCLQGSMVIFNIEKMISCGMYDEEFFLYCEEDILGWKFKDNDVTSAVINETYIHRHSESTIKSISSVLIRQKILMKSKILFCKKYYKVNKIFLISLLPYFILSIIMNSIIVKVKEKKY